MGVKDSDGLWAMWKGEKGLAPYCCSTWLSGWAPTGTDRPGECAS